MFQKLLSNRSLDRNGSIFRVKQYWNYEAHSTEVYIYRNDEFYARVSRRSECQTDAEIAQLIDAFEQLREGGAK